MAIQYSPEGRNWYTSYNNVCSGGCFFIMPQIYVRTATVAEMANLGCPRDLARKNGAATSKSYAGIDERATIGFRKQGIFLLPTNIPRTTRHLKHTRIQAVAAGSRQSHSQRGDEGGIPLGYDAAACRSGLLRAGRRGRKQALYLATCGDILRG